MKQSFGMIALNSVQPFASEGFAEKVALLVLNDRYPPSVFKPESEVRVVNDGDAWIVTFGNSLLVGVSEEYPISNGVLLPRTLSIKVRKSDAAILDIH